MLRRAIPQTMSSDGAASDVDWWRVIGGGGVLRNTRFVRPVVSLRGSSNLLSRAEPQMSSWCGATAISDVDWWRVIGGGGVLRYVRFVRPGCVVEKVVSLRGSNRVGRASSLWRSAFELRGLKRFPSPVAFAADDALLSKCPSIMPGKFFACRVRRRMVQQNKRNAFE